MERRESVLQGAIHSLPLHSPASLTLVIPLAPPHFLFPYHLARRYLAMGAEQPSVAFGSIWKGGSRTQGVHSARVGHFLG